MKTIQLLLFFLMSFSGVVANEEFLGKITPEQLVYAILNEAAARINKELPEINATKNRTIRMRSKKNLLNDSYACLMLYEKSFPQGDYSWEQAQLKKNKQINQKCLPRIREAYTDKALDKITATILHKLAQL